MMKYGDILKHLAFHVNSNFLLLHRVSTMLPPYAFSSFMDFFYCIPLHLSIGYFSNTWVPLRGVNEDKQRFIDPLSPTKIV